MNQEISLEMIVPEKCGKSSTFITGKFRELLEIYSVQYEQNGFHPPWTGYFIVSEGRVVGSCGFTSKPKDGRVEIAFWTFPRHQGEGIATEACRQMTNIALKEDSSVIITAVTSSEEEASAKVLEKSGFLKRGIISNGDILWIWERQKMYGVV